MTGYQTLRTARDARGVLTVTLDRPDKRNALSAAMIADLTALAAAADADGGLRAVVLRGAGPVFCAGGDLGWMRAQIEADRAARIAAATELASMFGALNALRAPLIGLVHGAAYGGGCGLAAVCDTVIATDDARFGFTETRLGLIPATIAPYVIARMGEGPARRVFMSARVFGAAEAQALGLVAEVVAADAAGAAVEAAVAPYLSVAPGAVGRAKALARALGPRIDAAVIAGTVAALADAWETEEARQGIAAFLERRPPPWA